MAIFNSYVCLPEGTQLVFKEASINTTSALLGKLPRLAVKTWDQRNMKIPCENPL